MKELELQERSSKSLLANVLDIDDDFRHGNSAANPASGYIRYHRFRPLIPSTCRRGWRERGLTLIFPAGCAIIANKGGVIRAAASVIRRETGIVSRAFNPEIAREKREESGVHRNNRAM